jgi:hypothetical protein
VPDEISIAIASTFKDHLSVEQNCRRTAFIQRKSEQTVKTGTGRRRYHSHRR